MIGKVKWLLDLSLKSLHNKAGGKDLKKDLY